MTPTPDWRVYHAHMLRNARQATTARTRTLWLNGAARARRELASLKTAKPAQGSLFS
jgi:hypothetical protein